MFHVERKAGGTIAAMPLVTEFTTVDLPYDGDEDWGGALTRFVADSLIGGQEWHFAGVLPVNAARAKALFSRQVERTDAEVAAILDPPAAPVAAGG